MLWPSCRCESDPMTLTVTNLTIARGGLAVLEGLSFAVPPGQALVVRGPNGIGKTTLLRTLAGLQPPVRGQITGHDHQLPMHLFL